MHDDGGSWQIVPSPSPGRADDSLAAVAAAPNGTIWAVGEYTDGNCQKTLTERYTGGSWGVVSSPNPVCSTPRGNSLNALTINSHSVLYAVGDTNIYTLIEINTGAGWRRATRP